MKIVSMVGTEQTVTRMFDVEVPADGSQDIMKPYSNSGSKFRPVCVSIVYRVMRGSGAPFWYPFTGYVYARRVLKDGSLSTVYAGQIKRQYVLGPTRNDVPPELLRLAKELLPTHPPEGV